MQVKYIKILLVCFGKRNICPKIEYILVYQSALDPRASTEFIKQTCKRIFLVDLIVLKHCHKKLFNTRQCHVHLDTKVPLARWVTSLIGTDIISQSMSV